MESTLSMRLRALRKSLSLTPAQVVKCLKKNKIEYSEQSIYKWEQGAVVPKFETIKELARIYDCNISYLVEGKKQKYLRLSPCEYRILCFYRTDYLFRSILTQIISRINRTD